MKEYTVKLKIKSEIKDLTASLKNDIAIFPDLPGDNGSEPDTEVNEFQTDGTMTVDGDLISIKYTENEENGFDCGSETIIDIDKREPGTVTMVRTGDGATACRFDLKHRRQVCVYEVAGIPVELVMCTRTVKQELSEDGGSITLDYLIELRGMSTQRNKLQIDVYR